MGVLSIGTSLLWLGVNFFTSLAAGSIMNDMAERKQEKLYAQQEQASKQYSAEMYDKQMQDQRRLADEQSALYARTTEKQARKNERDRRHAIYK